MDTPATSWKRPAFSPLNTEARQPTASVGSISPPRALLPPPTDKWQWGHALSEGRGGRNPDIQVSCKDTAPWFIVALLVPITACGHLLKSLLKVTSLEYLY